MALDPKALEATRKAVGTIPGAWLWSDVEAAILSYLQHVGEGEPVAFTSPANIAVVVEHDGQPVGVAMWFERRNPHDMPLYAHPTLTAGGAPTRVKPLEWVRVPGTDAETAYSAGHAMYTIMHAKIEGVGWRVYGMDGDSDGAASFPTDIIAKAAAQADYEARILSALTTDTPVEEAEREVERLAPLAVAYDYLESPARADLAESALSAANAEVERLREALRPFAKYGDLHRSQRANFVEIGLWSTNSAGEPDGIELTAGDFHRARAALLREARVKLTTIQRSILNHLARWPEVLRFGAHYTPKWWIEGGQRVSAQSCDALLLRGLISNTRHLGDEPGINCFSITAAGRAALQAEAKP